jgi:DNA-directed RNA polymerase beta subunit
MQINSNQVIKKEPSLKKEEGAPEMPRDHIDQDDAWTVIRSYFSQHGLVSQQISSFDRFLNFNV